MTELTTDQHLRLHYALLRRYEPNTLEQTLFLSLGKELSHITVGKDYQQIVYDVIKVARRDGWLLDLINCVQKQHPEDIDLSKLVQQLTPTTTLPATRNTLSEYLHDAQTGDILVSPSPIIIAIEDVDHPLSEQDLLRTERHMTVTLNAKQLSELERIAARTGDNLEIRDIYDLGVDAWNILHDAQEVLLELLERARDSSNPQPIAWAGKADLLLRIYKAISIACVDYTEAISSLMTISYGDHYFHPLFNTTQLPNTMQKRHPHSQLRVKLLKLLDAAVSRPDVLLEIAQIVENGVVILSSNELDQHIEDLVQQIDRDANSRTRVGIGFGTIQLTPDMLQMILSRLPCLSLGNSNLQQNELIDAIRRSLGKKLSNQAVPSALASFRTALLRYALQESNASQFIDGLTWTTWSWVGRPLFSDQFGEVLKAAYPHLMDLRSVASPDWYHNRETGIPELYQADNLWKERGDGSTTKFHLYLTGAGGTGKSCFLRYVYDSLMNNQRHVLPVWYKVDAPGSTWPDLKDRVKEEIQSALEKRIGNESHAVLPSMSMDLTTFLLDLAKTLQEHPIGINEIVLFIDQLERTFESGDEPDMSRLVRISSGFQSLLDTIGVNNGIRVFVASRKQYLPDFLSSFQNASDTKLHFNVLQQIQTYTTQEGFVNRVLTWCIKEKLVDKNLTVENQASQLIAKRAKGNPLNMMLSLIQVFSSGKTGKITEQDIHELQPWERRFSLDEQLFAKDDMDWYFLLAMAHARTEIVRYEEILWRLRLVNPILARRVDSLGRDGVLERLWLLGHLGRTIYARGTQSNSTQFMEFFHANLRDYLISEVMSFGEEYRVENERRGTPAVWRALERLVTAAREWKHSQQLLLKEDVRLLLEQKEIFVEMINMRDEGGPEKVEAFYLLFLRDTPEVRDELFNNAKECFVYSAVVHDDLGRWAFKQLFLNINDRVALCKKWLPRCGRGSQIRLLRYLIEIRDNDNDNADADAVLVDLIFKNGQGVLNDAGQQLANILAEPLFASRHRTRFVISLIEYLLRQNILFPEDNWHTDRFGEFCMVACNADREELLALIKSMVDEAAVLENEYLEKVLVSLVEQNDRIEQWSTTADNRGIDLSVNSRAVQNYIPPQLEIRIGSALVDHITDEHVLQWQRQLVNLIGLPLPPFTRTVGETTDTERYLEEDKLLGNELELRLRGRRVSLGEFYPGLVQTMRRHWNSNPSDCYKTFNEALQESVVWIENDRLQNLNWDKVTTNFDQAILNWLELSIRKHIKNIFTLDSLTEFLNALAADENSRVNVHELVRSISGNYSLLGTILLHLAEEFAPLAKRRDELMQKLLELIRQGERIDPIFLTQKLREHVSVDMCRVFTDDANQLCLILLEEEFEEQLLERLAIEPNRYHLSIKSDEAITLAHFIRGYYEQKLRDEDVSAVLVCHPNLRFVLFRLIQHFDTRIHVLSYDELSPEVHLTFKGFVSDLQPLANE